MKNKIIRLNLLVLLLMLLIIEITCGYFLSTRRLYKSSLLYFTDDVGRKLNTNRSNKLNRVIFLRKNGEKNAYPAYTYDPQVHSAGHEYWFSHPPNSLIVYCDEGSGMLEFKTNDLGFRKSKDQDLFKPIEVLLVGDSYTEGACINEPFDIASLLGKNYNLLNAGRAGSGPVFQLGMIREIFAYANLKKLKFADNFNVVWIIFTGNDLLNLAEERQTLLSQYLTLDDFRSNYFSKLVSGNVPEKMEKFHNAILEEPKSAPNRKANGHGNGETVVPGSVSELNAITDFAIIIRKIKEKVLKMGGRLNIIVLENHPTHGKQVMNATQKLISKECTDLKINCMRFNLSDPGNKNSSRNHLTELEYQKLAIKISDFIENNHTVTPLE